MFVRKNIEKVYIPPVKIQGIKSKLIPWISKSILWNQDGTYFEPFMGSGVVGFNLEPEKAIFSDSNPYIIQFYKDIQNGILTSDIVRTFLEKEGNLLSKTLPNKNSYYYSVRERFNNYHSSLDFLFLQRSNFNGMIRFNSKGDYNVPFGHKPERFSKSLITKICNQVNYVEKLFNKHKNWRFELMPFQEAFKLMSKKDFVYLDPPYINRNDTYYNSWTNEDALDLVNLAQNGKAGYALSMWKQDEYKKNQYMNYWSKNCKITDTEHFYFLGGSNRSRNTIIESLVISSKNANF